MNPSPRLAPAPQHRPHVLARTAGALCALLLAACGGGGSAAPQAAASAPRAALTVTTVTPRQVELPLLLPANGSLAAWQEASVGAETSGLRLAEVLANVGDTVRKGQVLASFATATLDAELAQARAAVAEAEAAAAEAAGNAERARSIEGTGALSAAQVQQYLTAAKSTQARLASARAAEQQQSLRLAQARVLAPDDGVISARSAAATVGAVVGSGTELFRLIRQGRLEWRAEVTSAELGRVAPGLPVTVTAASGAKLEGRVRSVGAAVDPQTRAALVYVDVRPLPGPAAGSARAGMYARGEFRLGTARALVVPQSAVVLREGFAYVLQVGPEQRVRQLKVRTGRVVGDQVELLEGVPADAPLVASGGNFVNDGDVVRVVAPLAPPAPAASGPRR